jgi:hypothetical protein
MATQTTYSERIAPNAPGVLAGHANSGRRTTGICETPLPGIPFGRAVSQGVNSNEGVIIGGSAARFRGVTIADQTLRGDRSPNDAYYPGDNVGVMETGDIWVEPAVAVAAKDPVFFNATTGLFHNSTGVGPIPGAYFKMAAGVGGRTILSLPRGGSFT